MTNARQLVLFADLAAPQLLSVVDVIGSYCEADERHEVRLECPRCGQDAGWRVVGSVAEALAVACPGCEDR